MNWKKMKKKNATKTNKKQDNEQKLKWNQKKNKQLKIYAHCQFALNCIVSRKNYLSMKINKVEVKVGKSGWITGENGVIKKVIV